MGLWQLIKAEATTNLVTNPSFETNTTGWIGGGTNVIARDTTTAKFGVVSLKCTYVDATDLGAYATTAATFPTASATYIVSGWIYVPSSWDGGDVALHSSGLTSAVDTVNHQYTDGTSSKNAWVYLESSIAVDTDVIGFLVFRTDSAPSASEFYYIDGVQIEEKSYVTTYCDGDQDGCEWSAGAHTSVSSRDAKAYQGGRIRVLDDDFSVHINGTVGIGAPQLDTNISELGLSSGGEFQSSRYRTRNWQLLCQIDGSSLANLHALKRAFIKEIEPRRLGSVTRRGTPVRFRYTGGVDDVWIDAYYTGGAEFSGRNGFTEIMPLRLSSPEPFFRTIGDVAKVLDSGDSASFSIIAKREKNGTWNNVGNETLVSGSVTNSITNSQDGLVWLAGDFDRSAGSYLATFNPTSEVFTEPFGTSPNNPLYALHAAANGIVYAGGDFTAIDGVTANRIAQYSTSGTWTAMGTGADGRVNVIKQGPDGLIYVGGAFTNVNTSTVARGIATWSGSAWAAVGPPSAGGTVYDLGWDKTGNLYVVGNFTNWNGVAEADYIAKWDGSSWTAVTGSVFNGAINTIKFDESGNFYVGGAFTTYGGDTFNYTAYYNGTAFVTMSTGVNAEVRALEFDSQNRLWVGGDFTSAGSSTLSSGLAIWDNSSWQHTDIDFGGTKDIHAIYSFKETLYIGGDLDNASATYAGSATATNNGSTLAYPVVYITRSGGSAATMDSIKNATTGAELLFNYQFLDGETVTIDFRPGRRRMHSSVYGEGWKLLPSSDVANFALAIGDNVITSFFRTSGSPTMTIWAVWQQTQLGVD